MLISIVIPVYNAESFLSNCLESVVNQTYKDIEIIIVNDGSTDKSQEIIDKYKKIYSNIRAFKQKNLGVSSARNFGVEQSVGKYILFLDSDDWLDKNYIENSVKFLKNTPVDLLLLPYVREYKNKPVKNNIYSKAKVYFKSKVDVRKNILLRLFGPTGKNLWRPAFIDDLSPSACKLYKTNICKKIKFQNISEIGAEDIWFNINYVFKITSAAYISDSYYHYNKLNLNSLIHKSESGVFKNRYKLYKAMMTFINEHSLGVQYKKAVKNRIVVDLIGISNNIFGLNVSFKNKYKLEKKLLERNIYYKAFDGFDFSCLPFRWKVFFKLCKERKVFLLSICISVGEKLKSVLK